jgi:hypothetical protein
VTQPELDAIVLDAFRQVAPKRVQDRLPPSRDDAAS